MRILCTNGWIRSNLGDLWMTEIVLRHLSDAGHQLTVASRGFPATKWESQNAELIEENTRHWNEQERRKLFERHDCIVHLPGGGLQARDPRMAPMLKDILLAHYMGLPYALSGHSICPLVDVDILRKVSLILAREPVTAAWLAANQIPHVPTVDVTWSQEFPAMEQVDETVLMLRWDGGISPHAVHATPGGIVIRGQSFSTEGRLVVSTSDGRKDARLGKELAGKLQSEWRPCTSLPELVECIGRAKMLITDRYHPTIIATIHEVPCRFIGEDSVRNRGLRRLLELRVETLCLQAKEGLAMLEDACASRMSIR